jgi:HME family heavy-metal exporter
LAVIAEKQFLKIPGIHATARRSGRAELDEHAEGVFNSEIDVDLNRAGGSRDEILGKMREALKEIPGIGMSLGQPISHRLDAMLSGVKAQIAIKIFGEDLSVLGSLARDIQGKISRVEGLVDAEVEKVTLVPQIQIIPDPARAKRYGLSVGFLTKWLEEALSGAVVGEVVDGQRRMAVVIRVDESAKSDLHALENLYVDVPGGGKIPLYAVATVQQTTGPNGINHENSKRRIVVMANTQGRDLGSVVADVKEILDHDVKLPEGYFIGMDGQFENQQRAMARIVMLAFFSLIGIFLVLYIHFQSTFFASQVMLSLPLAFFGGMLAVMLTGGVFSVGTLIGFVTLCGIASRNGIMMISHYLHLMTHEGYSFGRDLVIRGSLERLVPVMMTALTASLALVPLALAGNEPGKEILHPVAVVILGGLISSTLLDIIVTPTVFFNYGRASAEAAVARYRNQSQEKEVW